VDARRQEEARAFRWTTVHTTQNRLCVWRLSFTVHGGGRRCQHEGCTKSACDGGSPHCSAHGRGRRCQHEGCTKASATNGGTPHCIAHGGGRPAGCQHEGCSKLAQGGGTPHCSAHGGGRRCQHEGCTKGAGGGGTPHCSAHGGGWRCQQEGCPKGAAAGGTPHCMAHGGGRRCQQEGCSKPVVQAPGSTLCLLCLRATQPQLDGAERLADSPTVGKEAVVLKHWEKPPPTISDGRRWRTPTWRAGPCPSWTTAAPPGHAACRSSPPPASPSPVAPPSPPAATTDGALTPINPQRAQFHAPTQRREGRECGLHHCGAVRMCTCHGSKQGERNSEMSPTLNPSRLAPTLLSPRPPREPARVVAQRRHPSLVWPRLGRTSRSRENSLFSDVIACSSATR
jgi:hypothetical protein